MLQENISSLDCTGTAVAGRLEQQNLGIAYQSAPLGLTTMHCTGSARAFVAVLMVVASCSITRAGEVALNGHTFTLPEGFTVELIAGPPLVDRPIVADFDEQGRLYVAESSGTNDKAAVQLETKPHRILRLEDSDGDGRFDRRTVFADRMMFPEGTLWYDGSLYVAAPPSIWKLTDSDGDGVADRREEWFQGKTLTGCANDLHGPYLGPDGWIYWCKGAFAEQTYERLGRPPFVTKAAHIFRARPDASEIEPVMTGGMDNPVDVVFTPGGERIFTTTFLQQPGGGKRDGLIHAVYGGLYGKVNPAVDNPYQKRTSPELMPVLSHLGPAAPCGLTTYESDVFGPAYRDNLFACLFNLQKVTRHVLEPDGASLISHDSDFLVSNNHDFHPTDVRDDADGSLVVVDTGGWYKLCCPTSQLWKPDVLGGIYRVRRVGAKHPDDPRGLLLDWGSMPADALGRLLDDDRPAVRQRAMATLARRGRQALPTLTAILRTSKSAQARRNAVWTATRIDLPEARALVREALDDNDETTLQAAIHSVSVWRDRQAALKLLEIERVSFSGQNTRAAAEALGRIGAHAPRVVKELLNAAGWTSDRVLAHSLIFAVIEIDDPRATATVLSRTNPQIRRAALVALDQMDGGGLRPELVAPLLASDEPVLKETATWIAGRHPEWGDALAGPLRARLRAEGLASSERAALEQLLGRLATAAPIQDLLAACLSDASAPAELRQSALRAMAQSGLKPVPKPWLAGLAALLERGDGPAVRQAVATARALPLPLPHQGDQGLGSALQKAGSDGNTPTEVRLDALAAVPGGLPAVTPDLFAFLGAELTPDHPVATRSAAAEVLSKAKLDDAQLLALAESFKTVGPLEADRLLAAFARTSDEQIGRTLVAALGQSPALASLRPETLKPRLAKFSKDIQRAAEALYDRLTGDAAKQKERLEELLPLLTGGDIRRGQAVFNSPKAACVSCHAIGYIGGKVGPDLTRIGQVRTERDLLEAILFPSASFVRSYEPVVLALRDGKVLSGVPRKDAPDEVILATGPNEEARIAREDIEEMRSGTVSIMPAGLDQQLTTQDLTDLVTFLKACR
jgi:putative membrane-bound dehydrogenase-like protein